MLVWSATANSAARTHAFKSPLLLVGCQRKYVAYFTQRESMTGLSEDSQPPCWAPAGLPARSFERG
jgi:hypothetical protein